jgi:hypothetical protein
MTRTILVDGIMVLAETTPEENIGDSTPIKFLPRRICAAGAKVRQRQLERIVQ